MLFLLSFSSETRNIQFLVGDGDDVICGSGVLREPREGGTPTGVVRPPPPSLSFRCRLPIASFATGLKVREEHVVTRRTRGQHRSLLLLYCDRQRLLLLNYSSSSSVGLFFPTTSDKLPGCDLARCNRVALCHMKLATMSPCATLVCLPLQDNTE